MTLRIFRLPRRIPVLKDKLYMKHRCSVFFSLANINISIGILFPPVALLLSRFDIISRISFLVQGDIGNDSLQVQLNNDGKI